MSREELGEKRLLPLEVCAAESFATPPLRVIVPKDMQGSVDHQPSQLLLQRHTLGSRLAPGSLEPDVDIAKGIVAGLMERKGQDIGWLVVAQPALVHLADRRIGEEGDGHLPFLVPLFSESELHCPLQETLGQYVPLGRVEMYGQPAQDVSSPPARNRTGLPSSGRSAQRSRALRPRE